jgi:hypothetical protein
MDLTFGGRSPGWLNVVQRRAGRILLALLIAVGGWGAALHPLPAHAAPVPNTALINGDSVSGGMSSVEAVQAAAAGFTVTVVTGVQWDAMTAAQFGQYQLLITGDPTCGGVPASTSANAAVWAPVVMGTAGGNTQAGNRVLIGTDPVFHQSQGQAVTLIKDGIKFAGAQPGRTGMYYDASCSDNVPGSTIIALNLMSIGSGTWAEEPAPCGGSVSLIASHPAFSDLTTAGLQGWGCSVHIAYPLYRSDWVPLAIALDAVFKTTCGNDKDTGAAVCGEPYILVAGDVVATAPNICVNPATATNPVSTSHTVTAHVQTSATPACPAGTGVVGQLVIFTVSGVNSGVSGTCSPVSCMTDASGNVKFTYTGGPTAGSDSIIASFTAGGTTQTATATKTWVAGTADTIPPTCALTNVIAGPPAQIVVTVQDADDGLNTITYTATNATVVVDPFVPGTKNPVNITATKIDQTLSATLDVVATDMTGNRTVCDPTIATYTPEENEDGAAAEVTIDGSEGKVTIANSGLSFLTLEVNGTEFELEDISDLSHLTLDISSALHAGSNLVTIWGRGEDGAFATLVFTS